MARASAPGDGIEEEPPHDILAAEAFAMPLADPTLHHAPVVLPDDPTGIVEPHDVLAAEEFAMPAPRPAIGEWLTVPARSRWIPALPAALVGLLVLAVLFRALKR